MFKKSITIVLAGIIMAGCTSFFNDKPGEVIGFQDKSVATIFVDSNSFEVEIVSTPESTTQGLSGRDEIGHDGMLFIFSETRQRNFWMKDMQFAIDIIWINQGVVIGFSENVPPPEESTPLYDVPLYSSGAPVDMVLELPAGAVAANKITIGSLIKFR